jgi:hypothetical protein
MFSDSDNLGHPASTALLISSSYNSTKSIWDRTPAGIKAALFAGEGFGGEKYGRRKGSIWRYHATC